MGVAKTTSVKYIRKGEPTTRYWLVASVTSIRIDKTGNLSHSSFTIKAMKQTGEGDPVANPSEASIIYVRTASNGTTYNGTVTSGGSVSVPASVRQFTFSLSVADQIVDTLSVSVVVDGEDGEGIQGARGPSLRGPMLWSECTTGFQFYQGAEGEQFIDVVLHNDVYWACKASHTKSGLREPSASSSYWSAFSSLPFVATRILLAQYALVKNLGVETIEMKDSAGNVVFQAKDGNVTCKTGVFDGITVRNAAIESGTISGFTFNNSLKQLLAGTVGSTDNMLLSQKLIRFLSGAGDVGMFIGSTAIQDVLYTAYGPMRINVTRPGTMNDTNIGALIEVSGAPDSNTTSGGNYAFYIRKGNIAGFRPKLRRVSSSTTLTVMDTSVVITGSAAVTITLPSASCEDGQEYRMIAPNGASVTVSAGTGYTITGSGGSFKSNRWHLYIFDKVNKAWRYSYMNID